MGAEARLQKDVFEKAQEEFLEGFMMLQIRNRHEPSKTPEAGFVRLTVQFAGVHCAQQA
jgi:hypothetical protein